MNEVLLLIQNQMGILTMELSTVRAMCGVQFLDRKSIRDLMLTFVPKGVMYQWVMLISVCWYGHVLRREDGHVLRRAWKFQAEGQTRIKMPMRTWNSILSRNT